MKIKLTYISILFLFFLSANSIAQNVYNEIGLGVGPVSFRGDWGESGDQSTNLGNTGFGLNIIHFANFAYARNTSNYFNKHFKVRNQLSFHYTSLNHYGKWVDEESAPFLLDNMSGSAMVIEIGTGLEWNWNSIRSYERQKQVFQPYAGFGLNLVYFDPTVETSLPGEIGSPNNTWPTFLPSENGDERILNTDEVTAAFNFQAGTRYRLNNGMDLFMEGRWHYYFSDFVDGLNPRNPNNDSNDWIFMLNVGFVYYMD